MKAAARRNCGTCSLWQDSDRSTYGKCHLRLVASMAPDELPTTHAKDWCREWRPKIESPDGHVDADARGLEVLGMTAERQDSAGTDDLMLVAERMLSMCRGTGKDMSVCKQQAGRVAYLAHLLVDARHRVRMELAEHVEPEHLSQVVEAVLLAITPEEEPEC